MLCVRMFACLVMYFNLFLYESSFIFHLIENASQCQISYGHIKTFLAMEKCGISLDGTPPNYHNAGKADQLLNKETELSPGSIHTSPLEEPHEIKTWGQNSMEETASIPFTGGQGFKLPEVHFEDLLSKKRQKLRSSEEESKITLKATNNSVLDWLNTKNGVSLL